MKPTITFVEQETPIALLAGDTLWMTGRLVVANVHDCADGSVNPSRDLAAVEMVAVYWTPAWRFELGSNTSALPNQMKLPDTAVPVVVRRSVKAPCVAGLSIAMLNPATTFGLGKHLGGAVARRREITPGVSTCWTD